MTWVGAKASEENLTLILGLAMLHYLANLLKHYVEDGTRCRGTGSHSDGNKKH